MAVTETLFFCSRDGLRIRGMQFLPDAFDASKSYPAVILSHGFTGNYLSMEEWGRSFAEMGYAAFSFNFCGGGRLYETEPIKSEGKTTDMTISTEIADLKAVKAYAVSQPFVDSEHVLLLGVSQGGFVSALTAAPSSCWRATSSSAKRATSSGWGSWVTWTCSTSTRVRGRAKGASRWSQATSSSRT